MKFILVLWLSKMIVWTINIINKKRGTNYSGKIATKLCKNFIPGFKNIDLNKVVMVTGTNGKTGTTNMIAHTLKTAGKTVAINTEGANMIGGIATLLIKNSNIFGKVKKEYIVLEIDERSFPAIHKVLPAKHICITNIQKDQVQRNGDPDFIYQKIASSLNPEITLYLNNEEPISKAFEDKVKNTVYYGMERNKESFEREGFYDVTMPCPKCNNKIEFNYYNMESIGCFKCTSCNHKSEEGIKYNATGIDYDKKEFECEGYRYNVEYTTPFYIYNFALTIATCRELGVSQEDVKKGISTFVNPEDRKDILKYKNRNIMYLVMKQENPETMQAGLDIIARDKSEKAIFLGLHIIENSIHYTNTSYFFDCDFTNVASSNVEKYIVFTETVCYDTTNRMLYSGVAEEKIVTLDSFDMDVVLAELENIKTDNIYILTNWYSREIVKKFIEERG